MFPFTWKDAQRLAQRKAALKQSSFGLENLEGRKFLSASPLGRGGGDGGHGHGGDGGGIFVGPVNSILFSAAPSAVQTGLTTLAANDGLAAPTADQKVILGNSNGVETYSLTITGTGTVTRLTVDQTGAAVTAPTFTTSTFGALGTDNVAAATEISAIATALNLTAPASTTLVTVKATSTGSVYTVRLDPSATSTTGRHSRSEVISVDSAGNPVGNQNLPFSVIPAAIQSGINANLPTGTTALATDSTQTVRVQTLDGVVLYSTTFNVSGASTTITVNSAGTLTSLPSTTTTTFDQLTTTVQSALQTLVAAKGYTDTIPTTTAVDVYTEANGATLYSVKLGVTNSTTSALQNIRVTVDADGNPTVLAGERGRGFGGPGGGGCFSSEPVTSTTGSTAGSTSGSGSSTIALGFGARRR